MTIRINLNQLKGLIKMVKEWRSMVRSKAFKYYLNDIRKSGRKIEIERQKIGHSKGLIDIFKALKRKPGRRI